MVVNVTAASLLTIPSQTTGLQTLGLFLLFFFPALALIVIIVRCAGRFATSQFGWGMWPLLPLWNRGDLGLTRCLQMTG